MKIRILIRGIKFWRDRVGRKKVFDTSYKGVIYQIAVRSSLREASFLLSIKQKILKISILNKKS